MNYLITNSVPLNGGDEALLRAITEGIDRRFGPSARGVVLCKSLPLCQKHLPDLNLAADLEFCETPYIPPPPSVHGRGRAGYLDDCRTASVARREVLELYDAADLVISAPGGFFHDHYAIESRLRGIETALDLGKPVILLGQSTGPFWKPESIARVRDVFNRVTRICVRDELSKRHLAECGVTGDHVVVTADVAFLWRTLAPALYRARTGPVRHVGVCVRTWPLKDDESIRRTVEKAAALCRHQLRKADRRVTLISTCQGVDGYWDDSKLSRDVMAQLSGELAARCTVDTARRPPRELISALGQLDAFIGMRLHGCLLAMLGGTPAMGLAYEPKTPEIYGQMGMGEYQLPFERDADEWIASADKFLADINEIRSRLPATLDDMARRAERNLDEMEACLCQRPKRQLLWRQAAG